jgi:hypothetical protein
VQTVASSGSSSAQCGHVFTLLVSARCHDRLYRLALERTPSREFLASARPWAARAVVFGLLAWMELE